MIIWVCVAVCLAAANLTRAMHAQAVGAECEDLAVHLLAQRLGVALGGMHRLHPVLDNSIQLPQHMLSVLRLGRALV